MKIRWVMMLVFLTSLLFQGVSNAQADWKQVYIVQKELKDQRPRKVLKDAKDASEMMKLVNNYFALYNKFFREARKDRDKQDLMMFLNEKTREIGSMKQELDRFLRSGYEDAKDAQQKLMSFYGAINNVMQEAIKRKDRSMLNLLRTGV